MATIPGLYNTGDGVSAGQQDTHYKLVTPGGSCTYGYEATNNVFPVVDATWGQQDSTSQWLTPTSSQGGAVAVGNYYWSLYFDLTGYDPNTASLTGRGRADDYATVYLNGVEIGTLTDFYAWVTFSASTGFRDGINELTFIVNNAGSSSTPSGLRVEFTASSITAYDTAPTVITELASTGSGFVGNAQDTRYELTVLSGSTTLGVGQEHGYVVADMEAPATGDPWSKNNHASKWLTPFDNASQSLDSSVDGVYRWRVPFEVTASNKDALVTGRIMADNAFSLLLNDRYITSYAEQALPFDEWIEFRIQGLLSVGTNYFDIEVTNSWQATSNPTGVRMELYYAAIIPTQLGMNTIMFSCNT